jgi:hypothetical protein
MLSVNYPAVNYPAEELSVMTVASLINNVRQAIVFSKTLPADGAAIETFDPTSAGNGSRSHSTCAKNRSHKRRPCARAVGMSTGKQAPSLMDEQRRDVMGAPSRTARAEII